MAENGRVCSVAGCGKPHTARGLCHSHYRKFLREGGERKSVMDRRYGMTAEDRFMAYVTTGPQCWEWTGYRNAKGYGVINLGGKRELAHRYSYQRIAEIPDGMFVLHHCDNPRCVKFKHLFLGTKADNNADMDAKGRANRPGPPPGERNQSARLCEADVRAIRASTESGPQLAARYAVTRTTISAIRRRLIWAHVTDA